MRSAYQLKNWSQLYKWIVKEIDLTAKHVKFEFRKDGCEDFLLHFTAKIVWFFLLFCITLVFLQSVQRDNFFNILLLALINFIISAATPTWFTKIIKGDFFDQLGGALLQGSIVAILIVYVSLFIWPGWLVHFFNKAVRGYEKK